MSKAPDLDSGDVEVPPLDEVLNKSDNLDDSLESAIDAEVSQQAAEDDRTLLAKILDLGEHAARIENTLAGLESRLHTSGLRTSQWLPVLILLVEIVLLSTRGGDPPWWSDGLGSVIGMQLSSAMLGLGVVFLIALIVLDLLAASRRFLGLVALGDLSRRRDGGLSPRDDISWPACWANALLDTKHRASLAALTLIASVWHATALSGGSAYGQSGVSIAFVLCFMMLRLSLDIGRASPMWSTQATLGLVQLHRPVSHPLTTYTPNLVALENTCDPFTARSFATWRKRMQKAGLKNDEKIETILDAIVDHVLGQDDDEDLSACVKSVAGKDVNPFSADDMTERMFEILVDEIRINHPGLFAIRRNHSGEMSADMRIGDRGLAHIFARVSKGAVPKGELEVSASGSLSTTISLGDCSKETWLWIDIDSIESRQMHTTLRLTDAKGNPRVVQSLRATPSSAFTRVTRRRLSALLTGSALAIPLILGFAAFSVWIRTL